MTTLLAWKQCLPILLLSIFMQSFECGYVILTPEKLYPGSDYKLTVGIEGAANDVSVTGKLSSTAKGTSTILQATASISNGMSGELIFKVPDDVPQGSYKLLVSGEGGLTFRNDTSLQLNQQNTIILIQTDKAMYKPNQVVKMRILGIDADYKIVKKPITVAIIDKNNNKIEEFKNEIGVEGVVTLEFALSDEPLLGDWIIEAKIGEIGQRKTFKVAEYVLPKYEVVTLLSPTYLVYTEGQEPDLTVNIDAKYTYGKNVVGTAKVKVVCNSVSMEKTVDIAGAVDVKFTLTEMIGDGLVSTFMRGYNFQQQTVDVFVNVTEFPTMSSISQDSAAKVYSYNQKIEVTALDNNKMFYPGQPATVRVKVTDPEGAALSKYGMVVMVECSACKESKNVTITRPEGVLVTFEKTNDLNENMYISAKIVNGKNAQRNSISLQKYNSYGNSLIQVTDSNDMTLKNLDMDVTSSVDVTVKSTGTFSMLAYTVVSKGKIVTGSSLNAAQSTQTITLNVNSAMSPMATLIVYGITTGKEPEVLANVYELVIDNGMSNKVTLTFSSAKARANTAISLEVTSDPGAIVYVLCVDKSVQLLATGNDITQTSVSEVINKLTGNKEGDNDNDNERIMFRRRKRMVFNAYNGVSTSNLLKSAGLVCLTDKKVYESYNNDMVFMMRPEMEGVMNKADDGLGGLAPDANRGAGVGGGVTQDLSAIKHVRKFFPETWLWVNGKTSASGDLSFESKVPDTITSWFATAFSVSKNLGLGITSKAAQLISFQPFFVTLNIPYSVRRGENFMLIAAVFNYMDSDVSVMVTLERSNDFGVMSANSVEGEYTNKEMAEEIMVKRNTAGSVSFNIRPSKLGDVMISVKAQPRGTSEPGDQVQKIVIVKPEGFKMSNNTVLSVDMSDATIFEDTVDIWYPATVVRDSKKVQVQVTGDVMGPVLEGLESLLSVPMGCGEQNMLTMVPNIFVASYLKNVGKLSPEIKTRAVRNMKTGYQRELNYRHDDGSYSAFSSDPSGSTWLSAFVLKSFSQASEFITVDTQIQTKTFNWLYGNLLKDGQIKEPGRVIHQEMLGGTGEGIGLAAFVLIAMLESEEFIPAQQYTEATTKTINYLNELVDSGKISKNYEKAIVAYALTLAGSPKADILLNQLKNGEKPWNKPPSTEEPATDGLAAKRSYHPPRATSSDVETWAYVILAYTEKADVASCRDIVKWLISQQNVNGGFHSTQDTVVGLQALAKYGQLTSSAAKDIALEITAGNTIKTMTVNAENSLLLQSVSLPANTTMVKVKATGTGMVIVKVQWRYYTKEQVPTLLPTTGANKAPIILKVATQKVSNQTSTVRTCVSCAVDIGMSLLSVDLVSGHSPSNLEKLRENKLIRRTEFKEEAVHLYLDEIPRKETCFDIELTKTQDVENIQEAPVKAMAYYQTEIESSVMYSVQQTSKDFCELCNGGACDGCPGNKAAKWSKASVMAMAIICVLLSFIFAI